MYALCVYFVTGKMGGCIRLLPRLQTWQFWSLMGVVKGLQGFGGWWCPACRSAPLSQSWGQGFSPSTGSGECLANVVLQGELSHAVLSSVPAQQSGKPRVRNQAVAWYFVQV